MYFDNIQKLIIEEVIVDFVYYLLWLISHHITVDIAIDRRRIQDRHHMNSHVVFKRCQNYKLINYIVQYYLFPTWFIMTQSVMKISNGGSLRKSKVILSQYIYIYIYI